MFENVEVICDGTITPNPLLIGFSFGFTKILYKNCFKQEALFYEFIHTMKSKRHHFVNLGKTGQNMAESLVLSFFTLRRDFMDLKKPLTFDEQLDKPCEVILSAFEFNDEHLYEFCMNCRMYSYDSYQSDSEASESSTRIKIEKLGLVEKQKFALHYDFGDDWMFIINVQKIIPEAEYKKPLVLKAL